VGIVPSQKQIARLNQAIENQEVTFSVKGYEPDIIVVEGHCQVGDIFDDHIFDLKEQILNASRTIIQKYNTYKNFEEEYGIFCVSRYEGRPEDLLVSSPNIVSLLKSERVLLDQKEVERTLESSIKYAKDDCLIVDWDGAFIFDPSGQFDEVVELLELGNLQLLKYRILDYELDRRLDKLLKLLRRQQRARLQLFRLREVREIVSAIVHVRSQSIVEFAAIERNIKLIGDWYSAKVYGLLEERFHLDEWRSNIKEKFEALEDVYAMAAENFSLSFNKRVEILLLLGWFLLLIGWFALLVLEIVFRS
jgi:hypothetical protein